MIWILLWMAGVTFHMIDMWICYMLLKRRVEELERARRAGGGP